MPYSLSSQLFVSHHVLTLATLRTAHHDPPSLSLKLATEKFAHHPYFQMVIFYMAAQLPIVKSLMSSLSPISSMDARF